MSATDPVTFTSAVKKATEVLDEAGSVTSMAMPDVIHAKVAVADRWLALAELVARYG